MASGQRLKSLNTQHAHYEAALHEELSHAWHNDDKILRLKREKLKVREEIERLRRQQPELVVDNARKSTAH